MREFTSAFISELSGQFYIYQLLAILILLLYGFLVLWIVRGREMSFFDLLLAYPLSICIYSLTGFFLLSAGIIFNKYSIIVTMFLFLVILAIFFRKNNSGFWVELYRKYTDGCENDIRFLGRKTLLIYFAVVFVLAIISTSGIIPVSLTNDSMYFFSEYPRALVNYGKLTSFLDNFLTDSSQGIAILGTIPFFFGFDEAFGIQSFLNINYIIFFMYSVYEYAGMHLDKKRAKAVSVLALLMLLTSMPFVIMSRWFMANMFFMEFMSIVVYCAYKYAGTEKYSDLTILSILLSGLSIMRMEGALNAGVIILCIMMIGYKNKNVAVFFVSPVLILQSMYLYRIFVILSLHTGFQFMTKQKAVILIAFLFCILLYTIVIRNRFFKKMDGFYPYVLTGGLVLANMVILAYDSKNYLLNLKAFAGNVLRNSGWGLFASVIIGIFILIPKRSIKINYFDYTVICYVLLTIIAGWARGDNLYESFGDSGNRILIQVVPLMLMAVVFKFVEGLEYWKKEKSE